MEISSIKSTTLNAELPIGLRWQWLQAKPSGATWVEDENITLEAGTGPTPPARQVWGEDLILNNEDLRRKWSARAMNYLEVRTRRPSRPSPSITCFSVAPPDFPPCPLRAVTPVTLPCLLFNRL